MKNILIVFFVSMLSVVFTGTAFAACTVNQIDVNGDGTRCETSKFELTTINLSAGDSFKFSVSAKGTFYVDCGDGGTLSGTNASGKTISKSTNVSVTYTCEWASAGAHTIKFGGVATEYPTVGLDVSSAKAAISFESLIDNSAEKIASLDGSLSEIFPQLGTSSSQIPEFTKTFKGASNLTSIPSTLFRGLTGGSNANFMFYSTFEDCSSLTSIPDWLFADITGAASSMFSQTFEGCTSLSGYVPPTAFWGLVENNHPSATSMWYDTFENTQLATSCPSGVPQYITGYEGNSNSSTWNGTVSCGCPPEFRLEDGGCVCDEFTVTTTNLAANTTISFYLSAAGMFGVDWGDGTTSTIDRIGNTDSAETYSHIYTTVGTYTIGFCGTPTAYRVPGSADKPPITDTTISFNTTSKAKIAAIGGSLGALFPTLNNGATAEDQPRFYKTFQECTNISSIPSGLFVGVTGSGDNMYRETFDRCSGITTIPSNLFANVSGGAKNMFRSIFNLCTGLTAMPENLFSGVTRSAEGQFKYAFYGDTAMTGYIPPSTFSGLIANGSPTATNMWQEAFTGNNSLATSCDGFPSMTQFTTGYEASWNSKVSCQPSTCPTGQLLIGGICRNPAFTITTTSDATKIDFSLAAKGAFYVDCGDGGTLTGSGVDGMKITRSGVSSSSYSCTWDSAGAHTILFGGAAIAYGTVSSIAFYKSSNGTQDKIASVTGSLASVFPQLGTGSGEAPLFIDTFRGATSLTSIPSTLFSGITDGVQNMFNGTFNGCTNLGSIPSGLFADLDTGAQDMFANTFHACTSLTSIPSGMFGDISTGAQSMFYGTFSGCTNITAIPADLFSKITTAADFMFSDTFNGATRLAGYIPPTTFAGLIANSSPTATNMWEGTFTGTNVATSCDSFTDMRQYITNYESVWNGKVSCEDLPNKCKNATYYDENNPNADANGCVACPSGYNYNTDPAKDSVNQCEIHCNDGTYIATVGGTCVAVDDGYFANAETYAYGEIGNQEVLVVCTGATYRNANNQCVTCPNGYNYNTESGKTSINQCQIHCAAGHYLANAGDSSCSEVGDGYYAAAETLNYGLVSVHAQCPNPEERTGTTTAESAAECSMLCMDATYFDSRTDRCVACPSGYTAHTISGKTSVSQCQIACAVGTYLAAAGDANCIPAGVGYWAAASTVNYGSTSTRTQCAAGQTTNSNNAGSASECLVTCTGATYRNANNQCVPCPSSYSDNPDTGKTSINQCQHMCAAGTYMTQYTPVEYLQSTGTGQFIDTGYSVTSTNVKANIVVGTASTTTGDAGNFFGNIYETGGFSSNYKSNVFGLWMRTPNGNGNKATSNKMTFTAGTKYNIDYTVTGSATGTLKVNGGTEASKKVSGALFNGEGNTMKLFDNGAAYVDENNSTVTNRWGDKLFAGRIYSFKLWDGGTTDVYLKLDLIPVRRNSDNVLGFYNRVNGEFYPNVGTGSLTSATCTVDTGDAADACDEIAACSPVGYGYYAGQTYTNYGSNGVRNQCPNGGGTIVNGEPVNNAGSIYICEGIDPCTGANYPDYTTGICTPCPAGYTADVTDNKESISQCKIHCNDGYYVYNEFDSYCTAAEDGYYIAAEDVKYGVATEPSMCTNAPGHSTYTDSAATDSCPWVCDAKYYAADDACVDAGVGYYSAADENIRHECTNAKPTNSSYTASSTSNNCPYACDAGYYAVGNECVNPGVGYYSPDGDDARYACTNEIPQHSSYSGSAMTNNCPWTCDTGYEESNGECIEVVISCNGATYLDNNECVACPTGYDANTTSGKSLASQCQISCAAGTYLATANDSTCTNVGAGYYSVASTVNYGSTSNRIACTNAKPTNSSYIDSAQTNACPYACDATYYLDSGACIDAGVGYYSAMGENDRHECNNKPSNSSYTGSSATSNCPWACDSGYDENNGICEIAMCFGTTYMDSGVCTTCPTGYTANTTDGKTAITDCQINCGAGTYLATANGTTCTDVGAGYWAAGGVVNYGSTSTRTACATGLTTVGYGHGADELADCGRKLHVGNYVLYSKTVKPTTPAINIQPANDSVYYVGVSDTDHTLTPVHITQGNLQYTAFDDSILYGERDFETNTRITQ
jgi:hypothetical protein